MHPPNRSAPFDPELFSPISNADPTIVGINAKTIGSIRSPLPQVQSALSSYARASKHTFLSEYHPQARVVKAATSPPGVARISVCLEVYPKLLMIMLLSAFAFERQIFLVIKMI